ANSDEVSGCGDGGLKTSGAQPYPTSTHKERPMVAREPVNAAMDAAIVANPEDPAVWRVYADWLLRCGEPRGELIALQLAPKVSERERTLIAENWARWFGLPAHALEARWH